MYNYVMKFEWDEEKNTLNKVKHKISFELASLVFKDPLALTQFNSHINNEERWHTIGMVGGEVIVLVVHTHKLEDNKEIIRIISARKATSHERRKYEDKD